ncbi:MAG: hypothetical protein M3R58_10725 [Pseudomonadota bacterium]|nr:hypothetical protein [Pseudomonadota bacterium]
MKKPLLITTVAAALALGTFSTKANAGDPIAGAVVGTAIGAAVGGPVGAAVGALLGTAIASEHSYHRRHWDRYRDHSGRYHDDRRYGGRGYDRGYSSPPVRYYEPAPRYEPRAYRQARNEPAPRYSDDRRYESRDRYADDRRYESRDRYYDDRRDERYYDRRW